MKEMGCYEISLGDTIGVGTPGKIVWDTPILVVVNLILCTDIHKSTVRSHLIISTFSFNNITLGSTGVGVYHTILPDGPRLLYNEGLPGRIVWDTPTPVLPSVISLKLKVLTIR